MGYGGSISYSGDATGADKIGTTVKSADAFLKTFFLERGNLNKLLYADDPVLMRLKRLPATQSIEGKEMIIPCRIGRSPSQSKDFLVAQRIASNRTNARGVWKVNTDVDIGLGRVSEEARRASKSKVGAFIDLAVDEAEVAIKSLKEKRCAALFGPEVGTASKFINSIGVTSGVPTNGNKTLKLSDPGHASAFDIGDSIVGRLPAGTDSTGGAKIVESVDRQKGTITLTTAVVPAQYPTMTRLFREGDPDKVGFSSFSQWLPASSDSSQFSVSQKDFNGLDRSLDRARLAGFYTEVDDAEVTERPVTKAIRKMITRIINLTGNAPTIAIMNSLVADWVAQENSSAVRLDLSSGGPQSLTTVTLGGMAFKHEKGMTEIISSPFQGVEDIFLIDERSCGLYYLGDMADDFVGFVQNDRGGILIPAYNALGWEIRCVSMGNLVIDAPGRNGRLRLKSALVDKIK